MRLLLEPVAKGGKRTSRFAPRPAWIRSCDVLIAGESTTFGYPEIDLGLLPAIHFAHLPGIVGRHRAFELLFSGRSFGAEEARSLGLASRVVPDAKVRSEALALARHFA